MAVAETSEPLKVGARLGVTTIPRTELADRPPVSVAVSVTELVPVADGVPVIAPVAGFRLRPAGKLMAT